MRAIAWSLDPHSRLASLIWQRSDMKNLSPYQIASPVADSRMFFGKMWALDGPIQAFNVDYTYNSARFWAFTMANGLMVSMVGFIVGGAFVASALNDVTWLTFAMMASLDRLAHQPVSLPVLAPARTQLAGRLS